MFQHKQLKKSVNEDRSQSFQLSQQSISQNDKQRHLLDDLGHLPRLNRHLPAGPLLLLATDGPVFEAVRPDDLRIRQRRGEEEDRGRERKRSGQLQLRHDPEQKL